MAATAFLGGIYAAVDRIPPQHEELNRYSNGAQEFTCWHTLPGADGHQYNIWSTVRESTLKVGWLGNAVPGITVHAEPEQAIGIARQFCNTGTGMLPDGTIRTATPSLKP